MSRPSAVDKELRIEREGAKKGIDEHFDIKTFDVAGFTDAAP